MHETDIVVYGFLACVAVLFVLVLMVWCARLFNEFSKELRYLNDEISRTKGAEQSYWKRRRRRLWLSLLPFVKY